jgi:recombinational DNA repair ATPase RecF
MTSKLVLDSLEIRQFRGLSELRIEHLGRVNLIVGKNNVGKTTVLEALSLYARPGDPKVLLELLRVCSKRPQAACFGRCPANRNRWLFGTATG